MSKELEALETLKTALHNEWLRFYPQLKELDEKTKFVDGVRMVSSDAEAFLTVKQALQRLEAIDNANPSEALECLQSIEADLTGLPKHVTEYDDGFDSYLEDIWNNIDIIKQALLKAQEPKHYLKWEDLEWEELKTITRKNIKVKLNGTEYGLEFAINFGSKEVVIFDEKEFMYAVFNECHKQFFNDLHLERVEE